jgi:5,10-methylene-tetrahydrofolate dehydrogenase/methenyl tetrahydrofolate cyclohydrolase
MPDEHWLDRWQQLANACIVAGKIPGKPWTIRVTGHCPATGMKVGVLGRGSTVGEAMADLLNQPEMKELQCHPNLAFLMK